MPSCTRIHKQYFDAYLQQNAITPINYVDLLSEFVQKRHKDRKECSQYQEALRCIHSIEKLYVRVKSLFMHIRHDISSPMIQETILKQYEKNIQYFKEDCLEQIAKRNNIQLQLQVVINGSSSNTYISLHPRGFILSLMLICSIYLVFMELSSIQRRPHTRTYSAWKETLIQMEQTLSKHLARITYNVITFDYDFDMETCRSIIQGH